MAVSYVGATSGSSVTTASTFATSFPVGWAADDVAVLVGHVSAASLTMSVPAGWNAVTGITNPTDQGANSRVYVWHRVLQSGDTAPTITASGATTGGWEMGVFRGGDTAAPTGQAGVTSSAAVTSLALPSLTGVLADSALFSAVHARVASGMIPTGINWNAAYTEVTDISTSRATSQANLRNSGAYRLIASAGSYGGESTTVANAISSSMIGVLVEIVQAVAGSTVAPDGLAVPVAVGSPALDGTQATAPDGVAVAVAVGSPAAAWSAAASPDGVAAPVALGAPALSWAADVAPAGLSVPAVVGSPTAVWAATVAPAGVTVPLAVGDPSVLGAALAPDGITVGVAVGDPTVVWAAVVEPDGVTVPIDVGVPAVAAPGNQVVRPNTGLVARPSSGVVVRPSAGVVARPSSGTVARPNTGVVVRP